MKPKVDLVIAICCLSPWYLVQSFHWVFMQDPSLFTLGSYTFFRGVPPLSHLPKFTPSSTSCWAPAQEDEKHFKFNAVQRVGLYTQDSPGTGLQELGQWCQCLENFQQAKVWRALCSMGGVGGGVLKLFLRLISFPPSFLCYSCLAPFKSGCSLRSQSHLPKIISGSYPPLFMSTWYYRPLNGLPATITSSRSPQMCLNVFGEPWEEKACQCNVLL